MLCPNLHMADLVPDLDLHSCHFLNDVFPSLVLPSNVAQCYPLSTLPLYFLHKTYHYLKRVFSIYCIHISFLSSFPEVEFHEKATMFHSIISQQHYLQRTQHNLWPLQLYNLVILSIISLNPLWPSA